MVNSYAVIFSITTSQKKKRGLLYPFYQEQSAKPFHFNMSKVAYILEAFLTFNMSKGTHPYFSDEIFILKLPKRIREGHIELLFGNWNSFLTHFLSNSKYKYPTMISTIASTYNYGMS